MKDLNQKGFSLIELLIVVVIMGIISAFSIPYLKKAKYAAENAAIYSTTKIMSKEELNFFVQKSRYARLNDFCIEITVQNLLNFSSHVILYKILGESMEWLKKLVNR